MKDVLLAPCWRSLAKDGLRRAEIRSIEENGIIDRIISWGEWETILYASEECAALVAERLSSETTT